MQNKSIICFSKDWQESPTSNNHVMKRLSENNTVLWINSVGMRTPNFASKKDLKKIWQKLKNFFKGIKTVKDNLFVYTPIVIPLRKSPFIQWCNTKLISLQIRYLIIKLKLTNIQLWFFYPTAVDMISKCKEDVVVYYCTDDWKGFSYIDSEFIAKMEGKLLKKADIVFTTSKLLYEDKIKYNKNTFLMTHGVDYDLFSVQYKKADIPQDIINIKKPIIGFYGLIQDWIDFELLKTIAITHPEWSIVMIGKVAVDVSTLGNVNNIFFLGEKQYKDLPLYSSFFDVAIIPYNVSDKRMFTVNPTKLKQYLASGKPVVSVNIPEVAHYEEIVGIADTQDTFIKKIEEYLCCYDKNNISKGMDIARNESWDIKVKQIQDLIEKTNQKL